METGVGVVEPVTMVNSSTWRLRVRGALVLSACADALGAPFEGQRQVDPDAVATALEQPEHVIRWTDDTAQSLVLAAHLADHAGRVEPDALSAELAAAWAADPARGYGPGAVQVMSQIRAGAPWRTAARAVFGGEGSLGNGAAMRVAPAGLAPSSNLAEVARRARVSAGVSHAHPLAIDGAVAQAVAVAIAARSGKAGAVDAEDFADAVAVHATTVEFRTALAALPASVRGSTADLAERWPCDATALGSVPVSIALFLRNPDHPMRAVTEAIELGGDTDTIAAMTAAIVGARNGEGCIPAAWATRLEHAMRVWTVAGRLAQLGARR